MALLKGSIRKKNQTLNTFGRVVQTTSQMISSEHTVFWRTFEQKWYFQWKDLYLKKLFKSSVF